MNVDTVAPTPSALGQYWTPQALAARIVEWAQVRKSDVVLEPSCGSGSLVSESASKCQAIVAVELDARLSLSALANVTYLHGDFLKWSGWKPKWNSSFDLAIMNPPDVKGSGRLHVAHALELCPRVVVLHRAAILHSREADRLIWSKHTLSRLVFLHRGLVRFSGPADKGLGAMQEWIVAEIVQGKREHVTAKVEWWME